MTSSRARERREAYALKQYREPVEDEPYFDDRDEPCDEPCPRCKGDGMDPWNDYLWPCPVCGGEG